MSSNARRVVPRLVAGVAGVALVAGMTLATGSAAGAAQTVSAPSSGAAGSNILITGAGWPGFDSVAVFLEQGSVNTFFCSSSTDASGNLGPAECTLPTTLSQGAYTLVATDNTISASMAFTLNPGANVAATSSGGAITSVAAGQTLFLNGSGFKASSSIASVLVGTTAVTTTPAKPATSAAGGFSGATFTMPSTLAAGNSTVTVTDAASHAATFPLRVYAATDTSAASGSAGKNLALSGTGWPSNESVNAWLVPASGSPTFVCSPSTDANGNLGPRNCGLPTTLTQGSYTLQLTDSSVMVNKAFTLNPGAQVAGTPTGGPITWVAAGQTLYLSGAGFDGGSTIKSVTVGTTSVTTTPPAPPISAAGGFSGATFKVPTTAKAGPTTVTVTDASVPSHSATLHLTVFKATDTSASSGVAGTNFAVSGTGWPANDGVSAWLVPASGTATFLCSPGSDPDGILGPTLCGLPISLTRGSYTLLLSDNLGVMVTKAFTLTPGVSIQATSTGGVITSVAAGQTVFLSGVGFTGSSKITSVMVGATAVTTTPTAPPTSAMGAFNGATFTVPSTTAAGATTVTVTDAAHHSATLNLTVYAANDTSASSGAAGKNLLVTGSGWPLTDSVNVFLVQGTTQTFFCSVSPDGAGNLGRICALPATLPQGSYTLSLTDGSIVVNTPFTLNPSVTLTNTSSQLINSAARGSTVDFSGVGFVASGTIQTVKIGTTTVATAPATPALTAQGSVSGASFVVPTTLAVGSYTVTFTDSSGKKATAPLAVT
jgi:hypothetical protein